jgi:3-phosphoshikimate 1-carboxyvinyltransferase
MSRFGVISDFYSDRVTISKQKSVISEPLKLDFTDHPDLAQVMMTVAAALNVRLHCTGIRNLQIKETNRIEAMQKELIKLNARLDLINENECVLYPEFRLLDNRFKTYNDHRMILAFAPLAVREKIIIENPLAVRKSYPQFWEHVEAIESL